MKIEWDHCPACGSDSDEDLGTAHGGDNDDGLSLCCGEEIVDVCSTVCDHV